MSDRMADRPRDEMTTEQKTARYEQEWQLQCKAVEIAARDGIRIPRWLPQFRPSSADPVGDHYRNLARREMVDHG